MKNKPNRTRTHEFKVMLNDQEMKLLTDQAKKCGLSRSEYLRSLLNGKSIRGYPEGFAESRLGKLFGKAGK